MSNRVLRPHASEPNIFHVLVDDFQIGLVALTPLGWGFVAQDDRLVSEEPTHRTARDAAKRLASLTAAIDYEDMIQQRFEIAAEEGYERFLETRYSGDPEYEADLAAERYERSMDY